MKKQALNTISDPLRHRKYKLVAKISEKRAKPNIICLHEQLVVLLVTFDLQCDTNNAKWELKK